MKGIALFAILWPNSRSERLSLPWSSSTFYNHEHFSLGVFTADPHARNDSVCCQNKAPLHVACAFTPGRIPLSGKQRVETKASRFWTELQLLHWTHVLPFVFAYAVSFALFCLFELFTLKNLLTRTTRLIHLSDNGVFSLGQVLDSRLSTLDSRLSTKKQTRYTSLTRKFRKFKWKRLSFNSLKVTLIWLAKCFQRAFWAIIAGNTGKVNYTWKDGLTRTVI